MLLHMINPDFVFENQMGTLTQLVHSGYTQINAITSKKGSKRGGHYHKINREAFYIISGAFKLTLEENGNVEEYEIKAGDFFVIEPYQKHWFDYTEDTILVSMYDRGVELPHDLKDIYAD